MKKYIAMLLALTMAFCLLACGETNSADEPNVDTPSVEEDAGSVGMANPWVEYNSLEEINEKVGGSLTRPGVMGVEDKYFAVMNDGEMAEYRFTLNGMDYTFRFAPAATEDISGVWTESGTVFDHEYPGDTEVVVLDTMKLARWMNIDGQYVLMVEDNGKMETDTFDSIVNELVTMTNENLVNANGENG